MHNQALIAGLYQWKIPSVHISAQTAYLLKETVKGLLKIDIYFSYQVFLSGYIWQITLHQWYDDSIGTDGQ